MSMTKLGLMVFFQETYVTATEYVTGLKSKELYNSKLTPSHGTFLPNIKYFGSKIGIQFNNAPFVVEQKQLHDLHCKCLYRL